ncbi:MAG TPA: YjbQ family protein [Firmicutes bacterium]|nr:YjbQ family protein [Bacillota bacterium]
MISFSVNTGERNRMIDITEMIDSRLGSLENTSGFVFIFVPHTTCALTVNENYDPDVSADIIEFLQKKIPEKGGYRHREGNSDAHIKAALIGTTLLLPYDENKLSLGRWQGVFLCEFDGPRKRTIYLGQIS